MLWRDAPGMDTSWPERIVVGVDASPESRAALDRAFELAARAGSTVVATHAVGLLEEGSYTPPPDIAAMVEAACERTGCPRGLVARPVIEDGPAIGVLLRITQRAGGDLIVVGRRGSGTSERPLGSTSAGILDRAEVPVLVVASHRPFRQDANP